MSGTCSLQIDDIFEFPLFRKLVHAAKTRQHNQLTENQHARLFSAYVSTQPRSAGLLLGWCQMHSTRLSAALRQQGVGVRREKAVPLHRFKLEQHGIARLAELERKLAQSRARRFRKESSGQARAESNLS
ncbi:hypothetical protein [Noviherbaspirillum pedocola]|uniref:Uncharacterized protein n=1 Tax=Noviherbaspirillum pedocola TaxID=2801341 RepID=A0A934W8P0_9BURK|nr:hypothetical protein [Noviherbaspirillum pedocola]MBK4737800.1 hypothetical protein [Noviherbaspirillum pedocola]